MRKNPSPSGPSDACRVSGFATKGMEEGGEEERRGTYSVDGTALYKEDETESVLFVVTGVHCTCRRTSKAKSSFGRTITVKKSGNAIFSATESAAMETSTVRVLN